MSTAVLSVIVPTYNPHPGRLARVLASLRAQVMPLDEWELIIVDNGSAKSVESFCDVGWHPSGRVVVEPKLGLTRARQKGIAAARSGIIVMVDDDNVLDCDYLRHAREAFERLPGVGVAGGKNVAEYEGSLPQWFDSVHGPLGVADHGSDELVSEWKQGESKSYPQFAPVGAGLCIRTEVAIDWARRVDGCPIRKTLDRIGNSLSSGGDNDIVLHALEAGWDVAYLPQLALTHIIPATRLTMAYHARLLRESSRSWVTLLDLYNICPWPPLSPLGYYVRVCKAVVCIRPWSSHVAKLRWNAALGTLSGQNVTWKRRRALPANS